MISLLDVAPNWQSRIEAGDPNRKRSLGTRYPRLSPLVLTTAEAVDKLATSNITQFQLLIAIWYDCFAN